MGIAWSGMRRVGLRGGKYSLDLGGYARFSFPFVVIYIDCFLVLSNPITERGWSSPLSSPLSPFSANTAAGKAGTPPSPRWRWVSPQTGMRAWGYAPASSFSVYAMIAPFSSLFLFSAESSVSSHTLPRAWDRRPPPPFLSAAGDARPLFGASRSVLLSRRSRYLWRGWDGRVGIACGEDG